MAIRHVRNEEVYEAFKNYYRITDDEVESWRSVTDREIVVYLTNGDIMRFNGMLNTFGYLKRHEVDERGNYTMSDADYKLAFSEKVRRLMNSIDVNQKWLSEETGISQVSISHYLTGKSLPDCRNLSRIANALRCSVSELTYFE